MSKARQCDANSQTMNFVTDHFYTFINYCRNILFNKFILSLDSGAIQQVLLHKVILNNKICKCDINV